MFPADSAVLFPQSLILSLVHHFLLFMNMFLSHFCKQMLLIPILITASFLSLGPVVAAARPSSSLFPLEVFGSQDTKSATLRNRRQQTILKSIYDNPRYSNSSFLGDETGNSPFFYCPESNPDTDLFDISKIILNPNPPHINYPWVFHAHGYFREEIIESKGAFRGRYTVRNEDRNGLDFTFEKDVCDFVDLLEMDGKSTTCPPFQGNGTIHKVEFVDFGISEVCRISQSHE